MKRSPIKRKPATKNKVPGLAAEYQTEFPYDEWYDKWGQDLQRFIGRMGADDRLETNHLWTNPRVDRWSNFVNLGTTNHRWFHRHITAGRVLCLLVKLGKQEAEIDWYESHRRIPSLLSWAESLEVNFPVGDWMRPYWEQLVKELKGVR